MLLANMLFFSENEPWNLLKIIRVIILVFLKVEKGKHIHFSTSSVEQAV